MSTIVFAGPTITHAEVLGLVPDAVCRPPVARGDVYKAVVAGARAIVIIDGYFDGVPSVWHKEILFALSRGIRVLGASSMGALRAAELAPFGMIGVGRVFEAFAGGALEDDDEVALLHGLAEFRYAAATEALVDIRATLARALGERIIERAVHDELLTAAKALHYRERTYQRLLVHAPNDPFAAWLPSHKVRQKHDDAVELLSSLSALIQEPAPEPPHFVFTVYWQQLIDSVADGGDELDDIVRELGLRGPAFQQLWRDAQARVLALRESARRGPLPALAVQQTRARIHEIWGLADPARRARWMKANGVASEDELETIIGDEAAARSVFAALNAETRRALLDTLRIMGLYGSVVARLRDKRHVLALTPLTDKADTELVRWHFSVSSAEPPGDLATYVQICGYESVKSFLIALRAEYTYANARS